MTLTLKDISDLIKIKEYTANAIGLYSIDRKTINLLNDMLLLIDKKIISCIVSDEFKELVDYESIGQVKKDVLNLTNIYKGLITDEYGIKHKG